MSFKEYDAHDASGLAELVAKKKVSARELVETAIERIETHNPRVNAVVHKMYDEALKASDGPLADGPFAGVPFVVKDLLCHVKGHPTSNGSRAWQGKIADDDVELTRRFRKSGVIFVAKTNTPEFGIKGITEPDAWGPTRNPWDLTRTPGGSSGGTAAAVASGMVPMGHGGDGGGSIRIPSSHCGLFGLKPSRGRVPTGPLRGEGWSGYVQEHVLTRSVRDSARMLDVIHGPDLGAPYSARQVLSSFEAAMKKGPGRLRVAFTQETLYAGSTHEDARMAVRKTVELLKGMGHQVEEARPAFNRDDLVIAYLTAVCTGVACSVRDTERMLGRPLEKGEIEDITAVMAHVGETLPAADLQEARELVASEGRKVSAFLSDYDIFVTPTTAGPPVRIGELDLTFPEQMAMRVLRRVPSKRILKNTLAQMAEASLAATPNTQLFNQTGQPAMSVPLHWNSQGHPIGVQFAADHGKEGLLLALAAQLEKAQPWFDRRPPL